MERVGEAPQAFEEAIELEKRLSREEAAKILADFHDTSVDNVYAAFLNLRNLKEDETVSFTQGIRSGAPCIAMYVHDKDGHRTHFGLIDKVTGQPLHHIS